MLFIALLSYIGHLKAITTQEPMSQYTNLVLISKLYQSNIQCWLGSPPSYINVPNLIEKMAGVVENEKAPLLLVTKS